MGSQAEFAARPGSQSPPRVTLSTASQQSLQRCGGFACPEGTCDHDDGRHLQRSPVTAGGRIGHDFSAIRVRGGDQAARAGGALAGADGAFTRAGGNLAQVRSVLRRPGQPLDAGTRSFLEAQISGQLDGVSIGRLPRLAARSLTVRPPDDRFEQEAESVAAGALRARPPQAPARVDFSAVRVHADRHADESARSVGASAYTVGHHIVFASGQYNPDHATGRHLLAHELTHVLQQSGQPLAVQRLVGFLRPIARLFGNEEYDPKELDDYVKVIDAGAIENAYDSDNKARAITKAWSVGGSRFVITPERKALMIQEMQSGYTSGADESAILTLLETSYNSELRWMFGAGGLTAASLNSDFSGDNLGRLKAFYQARFAGGMDSLLKGVVQPTGDPVPVGTKAAVAPRPKAAPASAPPAAAGDFAIDRVKKSGSRQIFFGPGSATLQPDAQAAIDAIKADNVAAPLTNVRLVGFASADEPASEGQSRADAVKKALTDPPDSVAVTSAKGAGSQESGDFSETRTVEIVTGTAAPSKVDCTEKKHGKLVHPKQQPCPTMDPDTWTHFQQAWPIAKGAVEAGLKAVTGAPNASDAALIDRFFTNHDPAALATLRTNLGRLKAHVDILDKSTACGGQCDTEGCDNGSTIAYNNGEVDAASRMTLCVPTFKGLNSNDAARNLIHETAHGTSPLGGPPAPGAKAAGTADVAYRHERMLFQLSQADRLRNSDSYALFCLFAREAQVTKTPGATPSGIKTPETDDLSDTGSGDRPALKLALATLEKRLTWSSDQVGQLYGQANEVAKGTVTWDHTWAKKYMTKAAALFPLTPPTAPPTQTDRNRLAAIVDRYRRMNAAVKTDLTVTQRVGVVVQWAPAGTDWVAPAQLTVGRDFFTATPEDQVSLLLERLAAATRGVEPAFIASYVAFAAWIHSQNP